MGHPMRIQDRYIETHKKYYIRSQGLERELVFTGTTSFVLVRV